MKSNDILTRLDLRQELVNAMKNDDAQAFAQAFNQLLEAVAEEVRQQYEDQLEDLKIQVDTQVLSNRGVRQLTSQEKEFYQKFGEAVKAKDPKQALVNLNVTLPETVVDAVFQEIQTSHPLLSRIPVLLTNARVRLLMNTNGFQMGAWGELCDEIVKELTSGFEEVDSGLFLLSAFLPVCKSMLELGPEWMDSYVRQVLYEAYANTLEYGFVKGSGSGQPIGMVRQVGAGVTVQDGVYPEKAKIKVGDLEPETFGSLVSLLAVDPNGKPRRVDGLILLVSPQDYFQKVMPATTVMGPDGVYHNDVLPYPAAIIQSMAVDNGEAVLGMAGKYFATAGSSSKEGNIDFSDHYKFLENRRYYLITGYANGRPLDNNAFLHLDISGLRPKRCRVIVEDAPTPSNDATLAGLSLGSLNLSPAFSPATTTYTAATTNATNTVTATPADAGATVEITNEGASEEVVEVPNGTAVTWETGANTLTIKVTGEDGAATKTYTVTVTKS